jgi:hypothetical protein
VLEEAILAERLSTEYITLFVVSDTNAPVTVLAYDYFPPETEGDPGTRGTTVIAEITVNGLSEAGDLWDPGTVPGQSVLDNEIHNPFLIEPEWADLEVNGLNPNFKNPNFKNPNFKNPNWKNTDYMDPNFKNPNFKNPNFKNTTVEATSLQNPNFKNPNFKNEALVDGFVDVTYEVVSLNNTTTGTNADFAYGGDELDGLDIEVVAWQADELDSLQDCDPEFDPDHDPAVITESKVIAAKSLAPNFKNPNFKNPNFKNLAPADINDPNQGFVSFPLTPGGRVNTTVRIFCDSEAVFDENTGALITPAPEVPQVEGSCEDLIYQTPNPVYNPEHEDCMTPAADPQVCDEPTLNDGKLQNGLGYNFWAQKANTGETEIANGREQLIKDVVPPAFENVPLPITEEATGPGGAVATYVDPTATDSSGIDPSGVVCTPASGSIFAIGTTPVTCTATDLADPPNTASVSFDVTVVDTTPPAFIDDPLPNVGPVPATTNLGATVDYDLPLADDLVDESASISVVCLPASGTVFALGNTTVSCTATDSAVPPNESEATTFLVEVVDVTPPTFDVDPLPNVTQEATSPDPDGTPVTYTTPTAMDLGQPATVTCSPSSGSVFLFGDTTVSCTATDSAVPPNELQATFLVSIFDTTPPTIVVPTLAPFTADSVGGATVDYSSDVSVSDNADAAPMLDCRPVAGSVFPVGTTTVTCDATTTTAELPAQNTASASFDITVVFADGGGVSFGKTNVKAGSVVPLTWSWKDSSGNNASIGSNGQQLTVSVVSCDPNATGCVPGTVVFTAFPGNSGYQLKADLSWQLNWQTVFEGTSENLWGGRYSALLELKSPTSETIQTQQSNEITIRESKN